ncbi:MAG: hypothetical protein ACP5QO_15110 [Clostridia bacterium]
MWYPVDRHRLAVVALAVVSGLLILVVIGGCLTMGVHRWTLAALGFLVALHGVLWGLQRVAPTTW